MALISSGRWAWPWVAVAVLMELSHRDRMDRLTAVREEQESRTRDLDLEEGPDLYRLPLESPRLHDPTNHSAADLIKAEADAAKAERKLNAMLARERGKTYG